MTHGNSGLHVHNGSLETDTAFPERKDKEATDTFSDGPNASSSSLANRPSRLPRGERHAAGRGSASRRADGLSRSTIRPSSSSPSRGRNVVNLARMHRTAIGDELHQPPDVPARAPALNRIGLHEAEGLERLFQRCGRKEASRDGVSAQIVEGSQIQGWIGHRLLLSGRAPGNT